MTESISGIISWSMKIGGYERVKARNHTTATYKLSQCTQSFKFKDKYCVHKTLRVIKDN